MLSSKKFSKRFLGFGKGNVEEESIYILTRARQIALQSDFQQFTEGDEKAVGEKQRILLKDLIIDIELEKSNTNLKRVFARKMRLQTSLVFIISILILVATIIFFNLNILGADWPAYEAAGLAMAAGVMGSAFSQLTGLKGRIENATLEELMDMSNYSSMLTRIIIGLGAALILVFIIRANLLSGTFFPVFEFGS